MFSLGNIGQSEYACGESNLAIESDMLLACSYGVLGEIDMFGLSEDENSLCQNVASSELGAAEA